MKIPSRISVIVAGYFYNTCSCTWWFSSWFCWCRCQWSFAAMVKVTLPLTQSTNNYYSLFTQLSYRLPWAGTLSCCALERVAQHRKRIPHPPVSLAEVKPLPLLVYSSCRASHGDSGYCWRRWRDAWSRPGSTGLGSGSGGSCACWIDRIDTRRYSCRLSGGRKCSLQGYCCDENTWILAFTVHCVV